MACGVCGVEGEREAGPPPPPMEAAAAAKELALVVVEEWAEGGDPYGEKAVLGFGARMAAVATLPVIVGVPALKEELEEEMLESVDEEVRDPKAADTAEA